MRRFSAFALLFVFTLQSTASAATPGALSLPSVQPLIAALQTTWIFAVFTGQESRYEAIHAPAPRYTQPQNARPSDAQLNFNRNRIVRGSVQYGTPRILDLQRYANPSRAGNDPLASGRGGSGVVTGPVATRGTVRTNITCEVSGPTRVRPMSCVPTPPPHTSTPAPTPTPTPVPTPTPIPPTPTPRPTNTPTPTPIPVTPTPVPTATPVGSLATASTGVNSWWTYEEGAIPGIGTWMLNVANGNVVVQADDVDVPERGIDLAYRRTYNSQSEHDTVGSDGSASSVFGNGWTSTFDAHLAYNGTVMSVYDLDGARYDFTSDGSGGWTPPAGLQGTTLVYDGGCMYDWTKKSGTVYKFAEPVAQAGCTAGMPAAEYGRIQYIQGRNSNNEITFTYACGSCSSITQLTQIVAQHSDGDKLTLNFSTINGYPELESIVRPDGLSITYGYDAYNNLISVQRPGNGTFATLTESYSYNTGTHILAGAAGPRFVNSYNACGGSSCVTDGDSVTFSYSGADLTMVQDFGAVNTTPADGLNTPLNPGMSTLASGWRTEEFAGFAGTTQVTDNFGHSRAWTTDSSGRVTETQAWASPSAQTALTTFAVWNTKKNVVTQSTDVAGNVTNYTYDANDNTISVEEPSVSTSLGTLAPTALYAYDSNNNLIAYCDPNYVAQNHPTTCSATTGTTHYTYTTTATEPFGELTNTYDPLGYEYTLTYDAYGQPTQVQGTGFSQADGTTRTPTQTFTYGGGGSLLTYSKGEGTWKITYDTMHRPITRTDPDVAISGDTVTSYTYYNNDGSVSKTETPYQHANGWGSTVVYDADGNPTAQTVIRQASPSASPLPESTNKYYDGADRLVEVQQPQDAAYDLYSNAWITRYIYDLTGAANLGFDDNAVDYAAYGNLYKTQELLPAGNSALSVTNPTAQSVANTTFQDTKGTAFDGLDRPIAKYSLIVANGGSSDSLSTETMTYDGSNEYGTFPGQLTSDCNALAQCKYPGYDALERAYQMGFTDANTPNRTSTYDPDGHVTGVTSALYGTQSYTYDADGHKLTEQEASGGGVTSPATFTHEYYPDGKLKQLDVSSSGLSQTGLFAYSYRVDGLVQTQTINDAAQANVGSTSIAYTYDVSGRPTVRTESGPGANPNPTTWQYDAFARVSQVNYPACAACNNESTSIGYAQYDPQGTVLNAGLVSPGNSIDGEYQYTARGELENSIPAHTYPLTAPLLGNGVQVQIMGSAYVAQQYSAAASWDDRSGATLSKSTRTPESIQGQDYTKTAQSAFSYDTVGRLSSTTSSAEGGLNGDQSDTLARSYDDENHTVTSTDSETAGYAQGVLAAYNWGPTGHVIRIGSATNAGSSTVPATAQYDTLHWDGGQLVFQTNASGQVDDIKIGASGDITPLDPTFTGLTFWDRGPANVSTGGTIWFCHNAGGTVLFNQAAGGTPAACNDGAYLQSNGNTYTVPMPSSFQWTSAPVGAPGMPASKGLTAYVLGLGQGKLLGMSRADGFTDGINTIQGVRMMDSNAGTWTTPDAYAGDVDDPGSQKSYMWNNNNPVSYSDPSGFEPAATIPLFYSADGPPPDTGSVEQTVFTDSLTQTWYDSAGNVVATSQSSSVSMSGPSQQFATLQAAVEAVAIPLTALAHSLREEFGASIFCSGTCWYDHVVHGPKCEGGSDCTVGAEGSASDNASAFMGFWHAHPAGDDESSLEGHLEEAASIAKFYGIDAGKQPIYIWTSLGHNIETQRFTGNVNVPGDGLTTNLCTGCLP